ncbi:endothelin-converting enzyme 1-like [Diadema setosum]|uniref:endothelin-converting enzyme 1-like n=1 Tax=Diadema setosum TaxID=31175 RepID=UPI003B3BEA82
MARWHENRGRFEKKQNEYITMVTLGEKDQLEPMINGGSDGMEDYYLRPALRYAIAQEQKQDRCLAIMTLASFLLLVVTGIFICLLFTRDYVSACDICKTIENSMDLTADPCQDFYQYSCGNWINNNEIPEGHSKWGTFQQVYARNQKLLKRLIEEEGSEYNGGQSEAMRKAKDYYRACMNVTAVENAGSEPLKKLLNQLGGWSMLPRDTPGVDNWDEGLFDLTQAILAVHKLDTAPLFSMFLSSDQKNSSANIIQFYQNGIGFAAREFYSDNDTTQEDAYTALGAKVIVLLSLADGEVVDIHNISQHSNFAPAVARMNSIVEFEANLSDIYIPKDVQDDPVKLYNKMPLREFADMLPLINISLYVNEMFADNIPLDQDVMVPSLAYFEKLNGLLEQTPKSLLADYLNWCAIKPMLKYLPRIYDEIIQEYNAIFSGSNSSFPLWETCLKRTDNDFGFVTGALFVREMVTPLLKNETDDLIQYIRNAFLENIPDVMWMDNETKAAAAEKAKAIKPKIGFPVWIEDREQLDDYYATANISSSNRFENALNLKDYNLQWMRKHLGKPVDRTEWHMTPAEVNAYYSATFNEIVFPSGILQSPFYDVTYPMSMNFGAIGMVMGHEMTHGFDNHGRKFDLEGNLRDWWGNVSAEAYENETVCMVDQYSAYKVGSHHLNGEYTLAENIADNGGLKIAYQAYQVWRQSHNETRQLPSLGLTDDQLFFLGFSQVWCSFVTPQRAELSVYVDPHSAEKYRVNGAVSNMPEFAEAYNCSAGTPMNADKKCTVW